MRPNSLRTPPPPTNHNPYNNPWLASHCSLYRQEVHWLPKLALAPKLWRIQWPYRLISLGSVCGVILLVNLKRPRSCFRSAWVSTPGRWCLELWGPRCRGTVCSETPSTRPRAWRVTGCRDGFTSATPHSSKTGQKYVAGEMRLNYIFS